MNKKILSLIVAVMFFMSFTSAVSYGTFAQNKDVLLYQTCNNCTYCNFTSVQYPNTTTIMSNVETNRDGTYFNYTLGGGNTSAIGEYGVCYDCGNDVEKSTGCNIFKITPSGKESSTGESILYVVFIAILFGILGVLFYFISVLPSENQKNEDSAIIGIVKLKYLRILLIALTYPVLMIILNLMNGLAVNFTTLSIFAGTLGFLFEAMLRIVWPFTIVIFVWIVYDLVKDSNVRKNINKLGGLRIYG